MGDRGRLVIPLELRTRAGLDEGTKLILLETDEGILVLTRDQLKAKVQADFAGLDLVNELLLERRAAAARENED
jgi:AbrB family looped-hinge helix DNA binding protein